jgi:hypothetical protein
MLLTNKYNDSFYLGSPRDVKSTNKGYTIRWNVPKKIPPQIYQYDRAVLFTNEGNLIASVRIVPTLVPDNIKVITLNLNL